jgi:hypothetical protein
MRSVVEQKTSLRAAYLYTNSERNFTNCKALCSSDLRKAPHSASISMRAQLCTACPEPSCLSHTPTCELLPAARRPGQAAFCIGRRCGMSHPRCVRRVVPGVSRGSNEDTMKFREGSMCPASQRQIQNMQIFILGYSWTFLILYFLCMYSSE